MKNLLSPTKMKIQFLAVAQFLCFGVEMFSEEKTTTGGIEIVRNAEAFAAGYPLIIPTKNEPVVTEFSLLKSWDFQGGNYSLIKAFRYSTDPTWKDGYLRRDRECRDSARKAYYILKNYDSESKVVFQCSAFDREIVDVIPCDRTWFLILTNLDAQRNFMGEFPMNRLEECEKKAEVWNPEVSSSSRTLHPSGYDNVDFGTTRYFSYGESRGGIYTRHFSSDVDLPRFGRLENRGLYKQPWKFSWDGKSLIARPVGQRITQLKDVDFYRYDPDKKTWTPHNRDESEKTEPDVSKNGGADAELPEASPKSMPCAEAFDWRFVFAAGAAVALAAGTGIFLWRRRRGPPSAKQS